MARNYHVRALERGLLILELLNRANGMTIKDVAAQTGLPRPTAFRFLHTLMEQGYVVYSTRERQYRLTAQARQLSQGYKHSFWITDIAVPTLDRMAQETPWPMTLCIRDGSDITIAYITDQSSQLIVRRVSPGVIIPPLWSAVGALFLGYSDRETADQIRSKAVRALSDSRPFTRAQHQELDRRMTECQSNGVSVFADDQSFSLAVPVMLEGALTAAIAMRVVGAGERSADSEAAYIAALKNAAMEVEHSLARVRDIQLPL